MYINKSKESKKDNFKKKKLSMLNYYHQQVKNKDENVLHF